MLGKISGHRNPAASLPNKRRVISSVTGGGGTVADPFRPFITDTGTRSAWASAQSGSWVRVQAFEYAAITASIANVIKKGHEQSVIDFRQGSTTFANIPLVPTTPDTSQSLVTMEPGEYLVAFVAETWNMAATTYLGYTKTFASGPPEAFPITGTISFGGQRSYFVRKAIANPTDQFSPVTESLIPVVQYTQSPNAVANVDGRALRYSSSLSSDPVWVNSPSPKLQLIFSPTNPWE